MAKKSEKKPSSIFNLMRSCKGYNRFLVMRAIFTLINRAIFIITGVIIIPLVNLAIQKDMTAFTQYATIMIVIALLGAPFTALQTYCGGRYGFAVARMIRDRLGKKAAKLPIARLDDMHSGDTVSRLNNDLGQFREYVSIKMPHGLGIMIGGIAAFIVMLVIEWRITLLTMVVGFLIMLVAQKVATPLSKFTKKRNEELAKVNEVTQDAVGGYVEIKTYKLHKRLGQRFQEAVDGTIKYGVKVAKTTAMVQVVSLLCWLLPVVALMGLGGWFVVRGYFGVSIGSLIALIQLSNLPFQLLRNVGDYIIGNYKRANGAAERIVEFLEEEEERTDGESFSVDKRGDIIEMVGVSFSYGDGSNVLDNINLNVKNGESIAFVGESGCGKSTLMKLIAGFYDINEGSIRFGHHAVSDWNLSAMRSHMALVDQDTYLYPVSLGENIACGIIGDDETASQEAIEMAAKRAHVHHFIELLDEGYDSKAGERGVKLSGGQRQRIAMARAVLRDADVLLLDEPTSALDMESERAVQQQLDEMMEGKTSIIVAHRLSTIQNVDCIYVLDQGHIIESGNHQSLMQRKGKYYQLLSRQMEASMEAAS